MKCKYCGKKISFFDYVLYGGMCSLCDEARTLVLKEKTEKRNDEAKARHRWLIYERRKYFEVK